MLASLKRLISFYKANGLMRTVSRVNAFVFQKIINKPFRLGSKLHYYDYLSTILNERDSEYRGYIQYDYGENDLKYIAFYLPQFHAIPQNDKWWGRGFTEWFNVAKALPQYEGHYQPRRPGELGYYDLRVKDVQKRQIELAKNYGLYGFCYHYYWFSGTRILERPLQQILDDQSLDFPFCINWANENWTKRWDGKDQDVLLEQKYLSEDALNFIHDVAPILNDSRYIRINGCPLLMVYRPSLIPNISEVVAVWREYFQNEFASELYLIATHSFDNIDPREMGFDAAVEFAPNNMPLKPASKKIKFYNRSFSGLILDYESALQLAESYTKPSYEKYRGVCPSWDNEARRTGRGTVLANSKPSTYKKWLNTVSEYTLDSMEPEKRFIFINAWNEWAEGAYLEPDQYFGYAYLQATKEVLVSIKGIANGRRILLVSHDANPHGAQNLILHIAKILTTHFGFAVEMIVLGEGPLFDDFSRYANVHSFFGMRDKDRRKIVNTLYNKGIRCAITNTTMSGELIPILKEKNIQTVSLIHELSGVIKNLSLQGSAKLIADQSDYIVFPAKIVKNGFAKLLSTTIENSVILPQGLFRKNSYRSMQQKNEARMLLRRRYSMPEDASVILCVGYADHRKGIDLFVESALNILKRMSNVYFIWVGHFDIEMEKPIRTKVEKSSYRDHFIFPGLDFDTDLFYAGSDIYALTSREDPFPSVVLEALDARLPVIGFKGVGGFEGLLSRGTGKLVTALDTEEFATAAVSLLANPSEARNIGNKGKEIVEEELSFNRYIFDILKLLDLPIRRISVVVPNYNYARYIEERLNSIAKQDYPIFEMIVLDDASSDESVEKIDEILPRTGLDYQFIKNETNSGNVFAQWLKGVKAAKGEYIWIAEADDLSETGFLTEVMQGFNDDSVVLSYCQSKQIDSNDEILSNDYLDYVNDISDVKWNTNYIEKGSVEVESNLAIKNTIPNVSACVIKKESLLHVLEENIEELEKYRVAGDWVTYLSVLRNGNIFFSAAAYNLHRRHDQGVTISGRNVEQLKEILKVQQIVRREFHTTEEINKKARNYVQRLYEDFGLADSKARNIQDNEILSIYLED